MRNSSRNDGQQAEAIWNSVAEVEQDFIVPNKLGFHARVAAKIVKVATQFQADVLIAKDHVTVNGKSILDILSLECPRGTKVKIISRGEDAEAALKALAHLFHSNFGET